MTDAEIAEIVKDDELLRAEISRQKKLIDLECCGDRRSRIIGWLEELRKLRELKRTLKQAKSANEMYDQLSHMEEQ